ncbi:MAG: Franean1_4349 family RiPP [Chloroflexi bacterium]|nr:Franean1_4349 family RiPP [Chloroflexota bacterium]
MATEKEFHELIGRAITDREFRAKVLEDLEKAVQEAGYELTEEQMAALKAVDLKSAAKDLDKRISKILG